MSPRRFSIEVQPVLPERLSGLRELANDLYYSWDPGVRRLFRHLDPDCWEACAHNPKLFLRRASQANLDHAASDPILLAEYRRAYSAYRTYLEERPHTPIKRLLDPDNDLVAYFSAEYGFHQSIPIYAGGLGILAADYCKAMSHLCVPFVAVGMLYHQGYFTQRITREGDQVAQYPYIDPADVPVTPVCDDAGQELRVRVPLADHELALRIWRAQVGHIQLYLLDSDCPENSAKDRSITYQLYGGGSETRIKQEIVLGLGGVRALRMLGMRPSVWHSNEGHASFQVLERCRELVHKGFEFNAALEAVASNTVFTTHTPVPAGHDVFARDAMRRYFGGLMAELGIDEEGLMRLGASGSSEGFNMTALGLRGSRFHNGVSRIHGEVASQMCRYVWPDVPPEENPISYVTNGVDVDTFLGLAWVSLFDMYRGRGWRAKLADTQFWDRFIDEIPDQVYRSVHDVLKGEMMQEVRRRTEMQYRRYGCSESQISRITRYMGRGRCDPLVIGFARRFATYKRATLLFKDLERLSRLLGDPERPVVILFAGKAHPDDAPGQELIREVSNISMRPEFQGKVVLLEDYNLSLARVLIPGVDVWLNVPEYPKEACGTSGMKAAINGGVNVSVLDGWWPEAYDGSNGWGIHPRPDLEPAMRNHQEADALLTLLEQEIVPLYFSRDEDGQPTGWIRRSKASMKSVLPRFNSIRMAMGYLEHCYGPASSQGKRMTREAEGAQALAQWRAKAEAAWPNVDLRLAEEPPRAVRYGDPVPLRVVAHLGGLQPDDLVVECRLGHYDELERFVPNRTVRLRPEDEGHNGEGVFAADLGAHGQDALNGGLEYFEVRAYPFHRLLTHPLQCGCIETL